MSDTGRDRHEWQTEWQTLEPLVIDSPAESLPELDELVERLMIERGYPISVQETEARGFAEPEIVAEFLEARRIARLVAQGEDVDPGELSSAITCYRGLYEYLLERPSARG